MPVNNPWLNAGANANTAMDLNATTSAADMERAIAASMEAA